MDRPVKLHVRTASTDVQFLQLSARLVASLKIPKEDSIFVYDSTRIEEFAKCVQRAENASSLSSLPIVHGQVVIAEFENGRLIAFENPARYLETYAVDILPLVARDCLSCCCNCGKNPNVLESSSQSSLTLTADMSEEALEQLQRQHNDTTKKIVENYTTHINLSIIVGGLTALYNRTLSIQAGEQIPDELRHQAHRFFRLVNYKCGIVPLKSPEIMGRICSIMGIFDEAEQDDTRALLSRTAAPAPMLLALSRSQKRVRDREYMLHCLAFFAALKFVDETGCDGRMYL